MFLFVLGLLSIILLLLVYFFPKIARKDPDDFPEPPGHFIAGHGFEINSLANVLNVFLSYIKNYGKNVKVRLGPSYAPVKRAFLTTDNKLVEVLLTSNKILTKSENYKFLKPWLGNGLLISDGEYWRRHRKILTPAFHFGILKTFVGIFDNVGNIFVKNLKNYDGSDSCDLDPLVTLCTLDIICETAMDTKINAQNSENATYVTSVKKICQILINRCISPIKVFNATYWMTKDYYVQKRALDILHSFTLDVINRRKINHSEKKRTKNLAFLDLLLAFSDDESGLLTLDEIREEVDTFMFEGHDTTSSGICFTLFCLAEYPEIQEKVFQEQMNLFGDQKNPTVTYADLQNMKYLENVIKESLRLYPSVPIVGRYLNEDLHFDGRVIPKTTNIGICIYGMHRDPDYFPEPEKFNPERFENSENLLPFSYIPFSAGSRNCIGQKFAMLEMKSVISKVIRHFELRPAQPRHSPKLIVETVLKSTNGVKVGLSMRKST